MHRFHGTGGLSGRQSSDVIPVVQLSIQPTKNVVLAKTVIERIFSLSLVRGFCLCQQSISLCICCLPIFVRGRHRASFKRKNMHALESRHKYKHRSNVGLTSRKRVNLRSADRLNMLEPQRSAMKSWLHYYLTNDQIRFDVQSENCVACDTWVNELM